MSAVRWAASHPLWYWAAPITFAPLSCIKWNIKSIFFVIQQVGARAAFLNKPFAHSLSPLAFIWGRRIDKPVNLCDMLMSRLSFCGTPFFSGPTPHSHLFIGGMHICVYISSSVRVSFFGMKIGRQNKFNRNMKRAWQVWLPPITPHFIFRFGWGGGVFCFFMLCQRPVASEMLPLFEMPKKNLHSFRREYFPRSFQISYS